MYKVEIISFQKQENLPQTLRKQGVIRIRANTGMGHIAFCPIHKFNREVI